jgi:hypothetical protein
VGGYADHRNFPGRSTQSQRRAKPPELPLPGKSAEARDGLSGLWLAPATLLNRGQPPRVNGLSTRPTNPGQSSDDGCQGGGQVRESGLIPGGADKSASKCGFKRQLQVPAGCVVQPFNHSPVAPNRASSTKYDESPTRRHSGRSQEWFMLASYADYAQLSSLSAARLAVQRVHADYRGSNRSALPLLRSGATERRAPSSGRGDRDGLAVPEKGDDGEVGWVR